MERPTPHKGGDCLGITLRIATEEDRKEWDLLVGSENNASIFHTWSWLRIAEKYSGCRLCPLILEKGAEPAGLYPLFFQRKFGVTRVFSPPPGTAIPYLGPVLIGYDTYRQSKKESQYTAIQKAVNDFISGELKANYTLISLTPALDPRPFKWTNFRLTPTFDYYLEIGGDVEKIWQGFDENLRGHIKRTEKGGISVTEGSREDVSEIYRNLVRRYREQERTVTVPREYLTDLFDAFHPANLKILVARQEGAVVGGIMLVIFKGKVSYWVGGAKPEIRKVSPNDMAQWEAIKWGSRQGLRIYEEIGAGTERLAVFKAKYNPKLSIRFNAVRYSSFVFSWLESGYTNLYKPIRGIVGRKLYDLAPGRER